jgi:hypothetical protein
LVLANRDSNVVTRFSIENSLANLYPGPAGCDAYYLDGTVVGLHDVFNVPVTKYLLKRDISFVFERNQWTGWIGPGDPFYGISDQFVQEAREFLGSDWNDQARRGASQTGVLVAMTPSCSITPMGRRVSSFRLSRRRRMAIQYVPEYAILERRQEPAGGILYDASERLLDQ